MSVIGSEPFTAAPVVDLTVRRLGEHTVVINVGTELRHVELPAVEEAIGAVLADGCGDFVFDLSYLRRYETFALVRLARQWDRLASAECTVHVAARDARVVADLRRLAETSEWQLHASTTRALRSLLSAPVS
jgi:anti-anti-sigma regulatory factor